MAVIDTNVKSQSPAELIERWVPFSIDEGVAAPASREKALVISLTRTQYGTGPAGQLRVYTGRAQAGKKKSWWMAAIAYSIGHRLKYNEQRTPGRIVSTRQHDHGGNLAEVTTVTKAIAKGEEYDRDEDDLTFANHSLVFRADRHCGVVTGASAGTATGNSGAGGV